MNCIVDASGRSGKWQQALAWLVNMGYLDMGLVHPVAVQIKDDLGDLEN